MASVDIQTLREIISLCRKNGVLRIAAGDIELHFAPSALDTEDRPQSPGLPFDLSDVEATPEDPYDNPALYPGGQDPVAHLRKMKEERRQMELSRANSPPTE